MALRGLEKLPIKVSLVTNIPVPYRQEVYELISKSKDIDLEVIYCATTESNRQWNLDESITGEYKYTILKKRFYSVIGNNIHLNFDIISTLIKSSPDIVITTGFNPTHLFALMYCLIRGKIHLTKTDGTFLSESKLTLMHKIVRKFVFSKSLAFIGASLGSIDLYRSYGIGYEKIFRSCLALNSHIFPDLNKERIYDYDFIFSGRLCDIKNPFFAIDVAKSVAKKRGLKMTMVILGAGELMAPLQDYVVQFKEILDVNFVGFISQKEIPSYFQRSRLFLFPTKWDPWGVVANEACASGVPVLISEYAGAANELVRDGVSGRVLPLVHDLWVNACMGIYSNLGDYHKLSHGAKQAALQYSGQNAALGVLQAINSVKNHFQLTPTPTTKFIQPYTKEVVIYQRRMTTYRIALFDKLRETLKDRGIKLKVIYGQGYKSEMLRQDEIVYHYGIFSKNRYFLNGKFSWNNLYKYFLYADLIIFPQESSLLYFYLIKVLHRGSKFAYWGHGKNFQSQGNSFLSDLIKDYFLLKCDWWFLYTKASLKVIEERTSEFKDYTILNNAIDTSEMKQYRSEISENTTINKYREWGVGDGPIALFLGSLSKEKRLGFLIDSARLIRKMIPNFQLVIVGSGNMPSIPEGIDWIHFLGRLEGYDKALAISGAKVMLNPGMIGLSILDAMAFGVPTITCDVEYHSPEIAYLTHEKIGLIISDDVFSYATVVTSLLLDKEKLDYLKNGCLNDAEIYTMNNMTANFVDGIEKALCL